MGAVNIDNTGSGAAITLSSDGTSLLVGGSPIQPLPSPGTSGNLLTSDGSAWASATHTGFVFENSVTATGTSNTVVLTKAGNTSLNFTNESYLVVYRDISSTTSGTLYLRYTVNSSGTQNSSNVYRYSQYWAIGGNVSSTGTSLWQLTPNVVTSSTRWTSGWFLLQRPTSINRTYATGTGIWFDAVYAMNAATGCYFTGSTTYGLSFFVSAGNITGTIELYKLVRS